MPGLKAGLKAIEVRRHEPQRALQSSRYRNAEKIRQNKHIAHTTYTSCLCLFWRVNSLRDTQTAGQYNPHTVVIVMGRSENACHHFWLSANKPDAPPPQSSLVHRAMLSESNETSYF